MSSRSLKLIAGAAALATCLPAAAAAQSYDVLVTRSVEAMPTTQVSFADLDLGSAADLDRLRLRLRLASERVVGWGPARTPSRSRITC